MVTLEEFKEAWGLRTHFDNELLEDMWHWIKIREDISLSQQRHVSFAAIKDMNMTLAEIVRVTKIN